MAIVGPVDQIKITNDEIGLMTADVWPDTGQDNHLTLGLTLDNHLLMGCTDLNQGGTENFILHYYYQQVSKSTML